MEMKNSLERMYQLCDVVLALGGGKESLDLDGHDLKDILKLEMLCFLAYLSASDGVISWSESRFISELLDVHMTPDKLNDLIQEKNLYSTEFEERVPIMMQIFVAFDNAVYNSPEANDVVGDDGELSDVLFKLYMIVAKGLIEANGRTTDAMDENEENDLQTYLGTLRNYIDENVERHQVDVVTGYGKNTRKSEAESDGVTAPRKNTQASCSVKAPRKKM